MQQDESSITYTPEQTILVTPKVNKYLSFSTVVRIWEKKQYTAVVRTQRE
jgi:hypothetical protein